MAVLPVTSLPNRLTATPVDAVDDLTRLIGNTPLVRFRKLTRGLAPGVSVYGKAEWFNPGGSIKDRPALRMIQEGLRDGRLAPGGLLLDATSGNTGIGYAMIGAALGVRVRLCIPANVTEERKKLLRAYGAELILTDPLEGSDGAIREARRLAAVDHGGLFYPDQYNNPANWQAHYDTTGPELWRQTHGSLTHLVATLGTSGTFTGIGRFLRHHAPGAELISVQPDAPFHGIDGVKHMATALVPGIYDPALADRNVDVATEAAHAMVRRLAREEGVLAGVSSGAAVAAALDVARELTTGGVVAVLPDGAARYLGERFWEEGG